MKYRKTCMLIAVLSAFMLVSTVSAFPLIRPIERVTNGLENFNRAVLGDELYTELRDSIMYKFPVTLYRTGYEDEPQILPKHNDLVERMRENNIRILGYENYTKVRTTIEGCFTEIERKINTSAFSDFLAYWFDFLVETTITIFSFAYLLFGHNRVGDLVGILTYLVLMPIPVLLLSLMESCLYIPLIVTLMLLGTALDFEEIIYNYGLIGLCLVMLVLLPITMTLGVVAVPILATVVFIKNYWFILSDTLAILWDE